MDFKQLISEEPQTENKAEKTIERLFYECDTRPDCKIGIKCLLNRVDYLIKKFPELDKTYTPLLQ